MYRLILEGCLLLYIAVTTDCNFKHLLTEAMICLVSLPWIIICCPAAWERAIKQGNGVWQGEFCGFLKINFCDNSSFF